jgi:hypothetical protein
MIDVPMTMFSRLFRKTPPAAADVEARIVDSPAGSAQAMGVLADGVELRRLAGVGEAAAEAVAIPADARRAAQARLATLVDAGEVDVVGLMDANRSAALCVVALCADRGRLAQAISLVQDPAELASLVMSPSSRVRLAAAQRLEDPTTLRQLLKQVRERDKGVYKVLKEKCDALNAEARRAESQAAEVTALCASLEQHGQRSYDVHYAGVFEGLRRRWDSVTPASEWQVRARAAMERCEQVVAAHLADVREQAARQALLRESQRALEEADERARRETEEAAAAEALKAAKAREEEVAAQEAAARARAEVHEARERRLRRIEELLQGANELLTAGNTKAAAGRRRDIEEQRSAAGGEMPAALARQVRALDARLNELKHWKDFAVAPKRRELIAQMQTLIGTSEDPPALSKRIKLLQEEWRTMSKGIVSETGHDWEEFQRASQSAYEPCRKYFDEQAALRQGNLDKRREVFKRLMAFEAAQAGDAPDWRLIANVLREAPREWREHFPVEREAGRVLEKEFEAVMARLTARIDTWAAGNVAEKQALIRRAQLVASQADGREAADAVKRLQVLWKEVGFAPRDVEQTLWAEFRAACDAVFQKKQQAEDEHRAGLAANSVAAVTLCEEAERAAQLSGIELSREAQRMAEWRAAFEAIGELPRAEARSLRDRFERAIDTCRRRLQQQKDADAKQAYANLFEAGRRIRAVEWAILNGGAASERESLRQAAENFMAAVPAWPSGGAVVAKERLSTVESMPPTDVPSRERALRMLCVRAEILKERATPAEDEPLRREYQVKRLMERMGQGRGAEEGDERAMVMEWLGIAAIEPRAHEELEARFRRGLGS